MNPEYRVESGATAAYRDSRNLLVQDLRASPIPDNELGGNLGLYLERMHLSRILLMHDLYRKVLDVPGVVVEFGCRWGQNLALFNSFRGMHEPYNYTRRVIGFDTFGGFPSVHERDARAADKPPLRPGDYGVSAGWREQLESILDRHEKLSPLPHKRKWELVVGDATETFPRYLAEHPELIVSLAYFDFDLYQPTRVCLEALMPRLTRGSIVAFDELNCPEFPGETAAVLEVCGLNRVALRRDPNNPLVSWFQVE